MSLAKIKAKESKGKQKVLPKFKTILANSNITRCPTLEENEMDNLKFLLQNAIKESKIEPRRFATQKGICIGLESSLRIINNEKSSCVFISLSIKPNHIIGLISRNAEAINETQLVYAQPKLEKYIEEIFGVQALCMVFPKELSAISVELNNWVQERKKPAKMKNVKVGLKSALKNKIKKIKMEKPDVKDIKKEEIVTEYCEKALSGDFISFGKDYHGLDNSRLIGDGAVDALSEIINKIPISKPAISQIAQKSEPMEVDSDKDLNTFAKNTVVEDSDNSDDFLAEYKNLTVHKIKGNPNKKPKKKRKKNKKKQPAK